MWFQEPGSHCFLPSLIMHCNSTSTVYALLTTDNEKCMTETETFTLSQTNTNRLAQPLSCTQHFRYAHRKLVIHLGESVLSGSSFTYRFINSLSVHKSDRASLTSSFCIAKWIIIHKIQLLINELSNKLLGLRQMLWITAEWFTNAFQSVQMNHSKEPFQMKNSAEDVTARHNDCASFLHI